MFFIVQLFTYASLISTVWAECYEPSPAFPVPLWHDNVRDLDNALRAIEGQLNLLEREPKYDTSSWSVEITSNTDTIWSGHRTAPNHEVGVNEVDGNSVYRICSISKTFTVLGILYQHSAGNLSLDDAILSYIPELADHDAGDLPWKDITLRILASQLSGIPREFTLSDKINVDQSDPLRKALPPVSSDGLPTCDDYVNYRRTCDRADFIASVKKKQPVFAPNFKSSYSNIAFVLLGLALENVTGVAYTDYIRTAIFESLNMTSTSFERPPDDRGVIPTLRSTGKPTHDWYWDLGIQAATGGIYSSSSDMLKYQRYVMTHFNTLARGVNWFQPQSFSGSSTFYGMPWETSRLTVPMLDGHQRHVTVVTKAGGLMGYSCHIAFLQDYGLAWNVFIGGSPDLLTRIDEIITSTLVPYAESVIWSKLAITHAGYYSSGKADLNSSLMLSASPVKGLEVTSFISNGIDVLKAMRDDLLVWGPAYADSHAQLVPTLLYKDEKNVRGEVWRLLIVPERRTESSTPIWDGHCSTDWDRSQYAGITLNEVVFWLEDGVVELPAFRLKMGRQKGGASAGEQLVVQGMKSEL